MKVTEILKQRSQELTISVEITPPMRGKSIDTLFKAIDHLETKRLHEQRRWRWMARVKNMLRLRKARHRRKNQPRRALPSSTSLSLVEPPMRVMDGDV